MPGYVKVVLVTGGTGGLGRAICSRLAARGHIVYGTSRKAGDADRPEGHRLIGMDVRDERSVADAVEALLRQEGRIDVVVNNAGIGIQGPIADIPAELAQEVFDTNTLGPHRVCRAVLPHMRERKAGTIINISSVGACFGLPYRGFYSASKAALDRYGEALSIEEGRFGIHVVTVRPGEFNTGIGDARLRPATITEAHHAAYEKAMGLLGASLGKGRDPDDLARVIAGIVASPRPKAAYMVARGLQRVSVLAKKLLPGRVFERMLRKHYE